MKSYAAKVCAAALLIASGGFFTGCEDKGPVQKAGESVDRTAEKVKDAVDPRGPAEKAGAKVDDALKK